MKNLPYLLHAILFLLVIGLYVLHFSSGKPSTPSASTASPERAEMTGKTASIAYINMDSLFEYYELYDDLSKDFRVKREQAQKKIEQRGRKLEQDMVSFQRRAQAGLMSQNEVRATEEDLMGQQQDLQKYSQTISAGLMEEESVLNEKLYDNIQAYLKEYNADGRYDVILNYTARSTTFWLAQEGLDITRDVLDALNERYRAEKQEKKEDAK